MFAANEQQMMVLTNRLSVLLHTGYKSVQQLEQPLLGLARCIDFFVASGEFPSNASELCSLAKQICQLTGDNMLIPIIMVLMASLKNSCQLGWFSDSDSKEIINLYKEISSSFRLPQRFDDEMVPSHPNIQTIMDRFYPQLSLGNILACLEVKPGYGAYLVDFHISKNAGFSQQENVWLFVAQTDTIETSSCLISPQQVNFLLNGKGIVGRVYATLDTGPQIPTNVTAMLELGTNLLQVVGQFSDNYVIAIAFMDVTSFSIPKLEYVQVDFISQSSDSDVVVGPSRVCLNCPISRKHIKTPVKGQSCKHVQCFDLENYVEMNSRRPSWRCPHCNQNISFLDICVDQNMMKILNEAGESVEDVIIYPNGSWNNTPKSNGDSSGDINNNHLHESDAPDILDLTMERDVMDAYHIPKFEGGKPSQADLLHPTGSGVEMQTEFSISSDANETRASQMDDGFWSGLDISGHNLGPPNDGFDNQIMINTFNPTEFAPGPHRHLSSLHGVNIPVQLSVNSAMDNQYVRVASVHPNIARAPTAVQALAATSGIPKSRLTSGATPASMISTGIPFEGSPSITLNAHGSTTTTTSEVERLREYSRSVMKRLQLPEMNLSRSQQPPMAQSRDAIQAFINNSSTQTAASVSISQFCNPQRQASVHQAGHQSRPSHLLQQFVCRPNMSAGMVQSQSHLSRTNNEPARADNGATSSAHFERIPVRHILTSCPGFHSPRQQTASAYHNQTLWPGQLYPAKVGAPVVSVQQPHGTVQQVSRAEKSMYLSADKNVRPAGRMRGSLSGHAYEDAFNQFMNPALRAPREASRPRTSVPAGVPPELHEMITNLSVPDNDAPNP